MTETERVREKLSKGGIQCVKVGELKALLEYVPDDLDIKMNCDEAVEVVWYNRGYDQPGMREHLSFREPMD